MKDSWLSGSGQVLIILGVAILLFSLIIYYNFFRKKDNKKVISKQYKVSDNSVRELQDSIPTQPVQQAAENEAIDAKSIESKPLYYLMPLSGFSNLPKLIFPITGNYYLGRDPSKGIKLTIENQYISRDHALITINPDKSFFIEDLGSRNKTRIDASEILKGQITPVQVGQRLSFGHGDITYILKRDSD